MKKRLDLLLLERGLVSSREKAQALIMAGQVLVNDVPAEKAGAPVKSDAEIRIRGELSPYVGRGGEKLLGALEHFAISPQGHVALDVGASTGGFTDCMLQKGAVKVYAVDVGYNQLDEKLRRDERVVVMEQVHAKDLTREHFEPLPDFVSVDVSFISAKKILDSLARFLPMESLVVVLVKPQFEVGPEHVEKGGVVKDEAKQKAAVEAVVGHGAKLGFRSLGVSPSVLRGAKKGNQEYFALLRFEGPQS